MKTIYCSASEYSLIFWAFLISESIHFLTSPQFSLSDMILCSGEQVWLRMAHDTQIIVLEVHTANASSEADQGHEHSEGMEG